MKETLQKAVESIERNVAMVATNGSHSGMAIKVLTERIDALLTEAYKQGREDAVNFIDKEFNDERFAEFSTIEYDEPTTEEEAEFRMFWTNLLDAARSQEEI